MAELQMSPQDAALMQQLVKNLKLLELKLDLVTQTTTQVGEQLAAIIQSNLDATSITAPNKRPVRDSVCEYIETLKNFEALPMPGGSLSRLKLINYAMDMANLKSDHICLEFGVFKGESLALISRKSPGPVYGFDSFEGLPASEQIWKKGQFNNPQGLAYKVGENTKLVKGWFKDTMPGFIKETDMSKVRFVHMDSDIYSSAKEIFDVIFEHLPQEIILVFDEYWNYPGWKDGEFKAFHEWIDRTGRTYTYIGYMEAGQQVAVWIH